MDILALYDMMMACCMDFLALALTDMTKPKPTSITPTSKVVKSRMFAIHSSHSFVDSQTELNDISSCCIPSLYFTYTNLLFFCTFISASSFLYTTKVDSVLFFWNCVLCGEIYKNLIQTKKEGNKTEKQKVIQTEDQATGQARARVKTIECIVKGTSSAQDCVFFAQKTILSTYPTLYIALMIYIFCLLLFATNIAKYLNFFCSLGKKERLVYIMHMYKS